MAKRKRRGEERERERGREFFNFTAYTYVYIESTMRYSVICVWNNRLECIKFYLVRALPFGAIGSVYAFLRLSEALRAIMVRLFHNPLTSFFDDFSVVSPNELAESTNFIFLGVVKLLGWIVRTHPAKTRPFSDEFQMLGAAVDLGQLPVGDILVKNKPSCLHEIEKSIGSIVEKGALSPSEASSLKAALFSRKVNITHELDYLL